MREFENNKMIEGRLIKKTIICEDIAVFEIVLEKQLKAKPGQFVMLWIPNVGERPFSPTKTGRVVELAVKRRGTFTRKLFTIDEGSYVGVRGPYGNGFNTKGVKKALVVAGGIGIAALVNLIESLKATKADVDVIYSAKKCESMVFLERIKKNAKVIAIIEENKCVKTIEALKELVDSKIYDYIYCCGPEPFMAEVSNFCREANIRAEFSLERKMKCAVGICGSCICNGKLLCKSGPVFSCLQVSKILAEKKE
ncbi:MAG: FAD-binding oxidoreductase [Candidatus Diapherotrites archaeon]